MPLSRKLFAEFLGSMFLLACVVGSGIMGAKLSQGNDAIALLANALATAGVLYVLIALLGPVSGAHFNPAVSLAFRMRGELGTRELLAYVAVQILGAVAGVLLAHAMFGMPLWQPGNHVRTGDAQWLSEGVATFGLMLTILLGIRHRANALPALVASYIFAAYWFTASTSFAIARHLRDGGPAPEQVAIACAPTFRRKRALRWAFDHLQFDWPFDLLLHTAPMRWAAEQVYFRVRRSAPA